MQFGTSLIYLTIVVCCPPLMFAFDITQHHQQQQPSRPIVGTSTSGFSNWRSGFGEQPQVAASSSSTTKNGTTGSAGVTYYWGSHQVGESVLAFDKDKFESPLPQNVHRTITYQNSDSRISYLEVFVRNAVASDQVYVSSGGIGTNSIAVSIGTQTPTTYFEYKAILYGFE